MNEVSHLLGKYLNTMVADLDIRDRGQYLRDLFSKYEAEHDSLIRRAAELLRQLPEQSENWRKQYNQWLRDAGVGK